jgi:hypothetical protein
MNARYLGIVYLLSASKDIFILEFRILLRALYQGYWKNRLSQQLFKVFIYTYILSLAIFRRNIQYFWKIPLLQRIR